MGEGGKLSDVVFEINIEGDSDGYATFECPYCESEFKLKASELQSDNNIFTEIYCPYCGLVSQVNTFYTKETIEQAKAIAYNYMMDELNKSFGDMARNLNRNKFIKMDWKPLKKVNIYELKGKDTVEEIFECPICGKHEKVLYCAGVSKVYCSYCGVDL